MQKILNKRQIDIFKCCLVHTGSTGGGLLHDRQAKLLVQQPCQLCRGTEIERGSHLALPSLHLRILHDFFLCVFNLSVKMGLLFCTIGKVMSRRMQENNPSKDANVVQKILQTRWERGSLDRLKYYRGGNGKLSPMQMLLLDKLRDLVVRELAISLGRPRQPGYPTSYKVDLAIPQVLLAIEIDGPGHSTQTARSKDAKKQAKLESLGWRVLRYSNQAILENVDGIASEIRNLHKAMLSSMT